MLPGQPLARRAAGRARSLARSSRSRRRSCCGAAGRSSCAAGASVVNRSLNMFTLIALGVGVAYVYSVVATLAPGLFPARVPRRTTASVAVYFEAAAVIVTLVLLGQVLELRARSRTGAAIRALLGLAPKTARRVARGRQRGGRAARRRCSVGDRLRVRPGREGAGRRRRRSRARARSTSRWSPASRCRSRSAPGDRVIGGTVNGTGALRDARRAGRRARRCSRRSSRMVARGAAQPRADPEARRRVSRLVRAGGDRRSPSSTFVVWALVGPEPRLAYALVNAVAVLIIACPCALGPRDADVDHGRRPGAARRAGVLFKNAEALEVLREGRHAGRRQDRHADRGQAAAGRASSPSPASTRPSCCGWPRASSAAASTRSAAAIVAAPRSAASTLAGADGVRVASPARACAGTVDGRTRRARQPRAARRSSASTPATLAARAEALRARGPDGDVRRGRRPARRACSASPIRSRRRRRRRSRSCTPRACAS